MGDRQSELARADEMDRARSFIALFQHPIREQRHRALAEVVEMGDAAGPALVEALSHEEKFVRQGALRALIQIASPSCIPALQAYIGDSEGEIGDNRAFAMQAVAAATSPHLEDRPSAFRFFESLLKDRDDFVKAYAYEALGRLGDPRARPLIERGARDRDPFVAEKAAGALARLDQSAVEPSMEEMLTPEAIEHGLQSGEAPKRELATRELRRRIDELGFDPTPLLLRLLHGPNRIGRRSALEAIGRLQLTDARGSIYTLIDNDSLSAEILANALRTLASLGAGAGSERLMNKIRQFLNHEDLFVRSAAVAALASVPVADALPFLTQALADRDSWVRDEASQSLLKHAGPPLERYADDLAHMIVRRIEALPSKKKPQPASARGLTPTGLGSKAGAETGRPRAQEIQTVTRLVSAMIDTIPAACDPRLGDEMAPAGYACLAAPVASIRVRGLELLRELVEAGARPVPPTQAALKALGAALTSGDGDVVESALTVMESVLPKGSPVATSSLITVLYRGERPLALRAIALLGRAGDDEARSVLRSLSKNRDPAIASAATKELDRLRGL